MDKPGRKPDASDEDILAALSAATDPVEAPAVAAADVAEELPIKPDATRKRLQRLSEQGPVRTRKFGSGRGYWLAPDDERQTRLEEHAEEESEVALRSSETESEVAPDRETFVEEVRREVENVDLEGSEAKVEERREAIVQVVVYALDHDHVSRSAYEEHLFGEYGGQYGSAYSAWTNAILPGLRHLAESFEEIEAADTAGEWRVER
jgi:DNA-binding IscR family transcriptional regulator